ncbi:MAG: D-aminoacyl-tRNA deacylase [Paracoccaceae bacterium]
MRALVQRVSRASVSVDDLIIGQIDQGLLVLICAMQDDTPAKSNALARKISKLRIFRDQTNRMNLSLLDVEGAALVVSQFTLAADTSRGNRPGFSAAASPERALSLYRQFINTLSGLGIRVETGEFGADMAVSLVNDGPVTLWLDT